MYKKILTQADYTSLVTLEEAKTQLRIDTTFTIDDAEITSLIAVAGDLAQAYTNRMLTLGTVQIEMDEYVTEITLPYGGVTTVTEVLLDDVASTDFTFSEISQKLKITTATRFSNIKVTHDAGYQSVPLPVKQGILVLISDLYNHRESIATNANKIDLPMSATRLLDRGKYHVV